MSFSKKRDYLREIGMMVRRESIIFDPDDRVRTQLVGGGSGCYVGGVRYDYETGRLACTMYGPRGDELVPRDGVSFLDDSLDSQTLCTLSETVARYAEAAMYRARNMSAIMAVIDQSKEQSLDFGSAALSAPVLQVDTRRDGSLEPGRLKGLFRPNGGSDVYMNIYLLGRDEPFSYPLSRLSDMGVLSVYRFVIGQLGLEQEQEQDAVVRFTQKRDEPVKKKGRTI